jgi:hypothetical protein
MATCHKVSQVSQTSLFDEFPDLPFTGELFTSSRSKHLAAMHDCKQVRSRPFFLPANRPEPVQNEKMPS